MAIVDLDQQQSLALIAEMTSTRNLLAYGVRVVRTGAFIDTTRDPILTMLSIGFEKLYKLTLGLIELDRDKKWPPMAVMKAHGHQLTPMHEAVMDELRTRAAGSTAYVQGILAEVDADPVVTPLIAALDAYGRRGRFYYLDQLGNAPQLVNPDHAWREIEEVGFKDPAVDALYRVAIENTGDNAAWEKATRALHDRIADTAERIWTAVAICGRNHAFGETGAVFGFEVHPKAVGRQQPRHLVDLRGGLPPVDRSQLPVARAMSNRARPRGAGRGCRGA